jgi:N6-L-threonylcarbamoyladenine synthase
MMGREVPLPALGVVLSGGHTLLLKIDEIGSYQPIGSTVDDAIGEAFDKTATLLGLPYPGGPLLEKLAETGDQAAFRFPTGQVKGRPFDFSYSGLKTSVLYAFQKQELTDRIRSDLAASFQEAAFQAVLSRVLLAKKTFPSLASVVLGGGVTANSRLKKLFSSEIPLPLFFPPPELSTDNAAMIAGLGYHQLKKHPQGEPFEVMTRIVFEN